MEGDGDGDVVEGGGDGDDGDPCGSGALSRGGPHVLRVSDELPVHGDHGGPPACNTQSYISSLPMHHIIVIVSGPDYFPIYTHEQGKFQ